MSAVTAPAPEKESRKKPKADTSDRAVAENRLGQRLVAPAVFMMIFQKIMFPLIIKAAMCGLYKKIKMINHYICIPPHTLITCPVT